MAKEIPFQKITLRPFNLNDQTTLNALGEKICPPETKRILIDHINTCYVAHRFKYPQKPKEFYIIPFLGMHKTFENFSLKPPEFACLWLPSVALNAEQIIADAPEDLKEWLSIIAWDYCSFSIFRSNHVLVADLSMGFPTFVLWENNYQFNPECCILAEPCG
ncbi:hypothetical protein KKA39_02685 [Patescibacteria group bacterium]|nr:hypothetical protein [Patescibacteria group bacterium]MBU1728183.1 hypothetical protein [Patescibacteria group bacterium]